MSGRRREAVLVESKRYGFAPQRFLWRGRRYQVQEVLRCWTETRGTGSSRVEQRWFRVRCEDQILDIAQDLLSSAWSIERVQPQLRSLLRRCPEWA
ncbi:MAG: DUF6504 family protein [Anaerolineae bacterium]